MIIGKIIMSLVTVFIHMAVIFIYWQGGISQHYRASWSYPYTLMLLTMMVFSALMPYLRRSGVHLVLLMIRLLLTTVLAIPFASEPLNFGFIFALFIFEAFLYLPSILAVIGVAICVTVNIVLANLHISLWDKPAGKLDLEGFILSQALYAICALVGYYLAREQRLREIHSKTLDDLRDSNKYLAITNINLQTLAAEEKNKTLIAERNRIAREIHDTVAYTLTNLISLLDAYRERLTADAQEVPDNIIQARNLARDGLGDIRMVLRGLRPRENEGYSGLGSIKHLSEVFTKAAGIRIVLNYGNVPQFSDKTVEDVMYRVVQEGLTNALRHGHATEVLISFSREEDGIELSMRDNGQGLDAINEGFGLMGIRERVMALDGKMAAYSKPGLGFTLRVWVPLRKEAIEYGTAKISYSR